MNFKWFRMLFPPLNGDLRQMCLRRTAPQSKTISRMSKHVKFIAPGKQSRLDILKNTEFMEQISKKAKFKSVAEDSAGSKPSKKKLTTLARSRQPSRCFVRHGFAKKHGRVSQCKLSKRLTNLERFHKKNEDSKSAPSVLSAEDNLIDDDDNNKDVKQRHSKSFSLKHRTGFLARPKQHKNQVNQMSNWQIVPNQRKTMPKSPNYYLVRRELLKGKENFKSKNEKFASAIPVLEKRKSLGSQSAINLKKSSKSTDLPLSNTLIPRPKSESRAKRKLPQENDYNTFFHSEAKYLLSKQSDQPIPKLEPKEEPKAKPKTTVFNKDSYTKFKDLIFKPIKPPKSIDITYKKIKIKPVEITTKKTIDAKGPKVNKLTNPRSPITAPITPIRPVTPTSSIKPTVAINPIKCMTPIKISKPIKPTEIVIERKSVPKADTKDVIPQELSEKEFKSKYLSNFTSARQVINTNAQRLTVLGNVISEADYAKEVLSRKRLSANTRMVTGKGISEADYALQVQSRKLFDDKSKKLLEESKISPTPKMEIENPNQSNDQDHVKLNVSDEEVDDTKDKDVGKSKMLEPKYKSFGDIAKRHKFFDEGLKYKPKFKVTYPVYPAAGANLNALKVKPLPFYKKLTYALEDSNRFNWNLVNQMLIDPEEGKNVAVASRYDLKPVKNSQSNDISRSIGSHKMSVLPNQSGHKLLTMCRPTAMSSRNREQRPYSQKSQKPRRSKEITLTHNLKHQNSLENFYRNKIRQKCLKPYRMNSNIDDLDLSSLKLNASSDVQTKDVDGSNNLNDTDKDRDGFKQMLPCRVCGLFHKVQKNGQCPLAVMMNSRMDKNTLNLFRRTFSTCTKRNIHMTTDEFLNICRYCGLVHNDAHKTCPMREALKLFMANDKKECKLIRPIGLAKFPEKEVMIKRIQNLHDKLKLFNVVKMASLKNNCPVCGPYDGRVQFKKPVADVSKPDIKIPRDAKERKRDKIGLRSIVKHYHKNKKAATLRTFQHSKELKNEEFYKFKSNLGEMLKELMKEVNPNVRLDKNAKIIKGKITLVMEGEGDQVNVETPDNDLLSELTSNRAVCGSTHNNVNTKQDSWHKFDGTCRRINSTRNNSSTSGSKSYRSFNTSCRFNSDFKKMELDRQSTSPPPSVNKFLNDVKDKKSVHSPTLVDVAVMPRYYTPKVQEKWKHYKSWAENVANNVEKTGSSNNTDAANATISSVRYHFPEMHTFELTKKGKKLHDCMQHLKQQIESAEMDLMKTKSQPVFGNKRNINITINTKPHPFSGRRTRIMMKEKRSANSLDLNKAKKLKEPAKPKIGWKRNSGISPLDCVGKKITMTGTRRSSHKEFLRKARVKGNGNAQKHTENGSKQATGSAGLSGPGGRTTVCPVKENGDDARKLCAKDENFRDTVKTLLKVQNGCEFELLQARMRRERCKFEKANREEEFYKFYRNDATRTSAGETCKVHYKEKCDAFDGKSRGRDSTDVEYGSARFIHRCKPNTKEEEKPATLVSKTRGFLDMFLRSKDAGPPKPKWAKTPPKCSKKNEDMVKGANEGLELAKADAPEQNGDGSGGDNGLGGHDDKGDCAGGGGPVKASKYQFTKPTTEVVLEFVTEDCRTESEKQAEDLVKEKAPCSASASKGTEYDIKTKPKVFNAESQKKVDEKFAQSQEFFDKKVQQKDIELEQAEEEPVLMSKAVEDIPYKECKGEPVFEEVSIKSAEKPVKKKPIVYKFEEKAHRDKYQFEDKDLNEIKYHFQDRVNKQKVKYDYLNFGKSDKKCLKDDDEDDQSLDRHSDQLSRDSDFDALSTKSNRMSDDTMSYKTAATNICHNDLSLKKAIKDVLRCNKYHESPEKRRDSSPARSEGKHRNTSPDRHSEKSGKSFVKSPEKFGHKARSVERRESNLDNFPRLNLKRQSKSPDTSPGRFSRKSEHSLELKSKSPKRNQKLYEENFQRIFHEDDDKEIELPAMKCGADKMTRKEKGSIASRHKSPSSSGVVKSPRSKPVTQIINSLLEEDDHDFESDKTSYTDVKILARDLARSEQNKRDRLDDIREVLVPVAAKTLKKVPKEKEVVKEPVECIKMKVKDEESKVQEVQAKPKEVSKPLKKVSKEKEVVKEPVDPNKMKLKEEEPKVQEVQAKPKEVSKPEPIKESLSYPPHSQQSLHSAYEDIDLQKSLHVCYAQDHAKESKDSKEKKDLEEKISGTEPAKQIKYYPRLSVPDQNPLLKKEVYKTVGNEPIRSERHQFVGKEIKKLENLVKEIKPNDDKRVFYYNPRLEEIKKTREQAFRMKAVPLTVPLAHSTPGNSTVQGVSPSPRTPSPTPTVQPGAVHPTLNNLTNTSGNLHFPGIDNPKNSLELKPSPEVISLASSKQEATKTKHNPEVISISPSKLEASRLKHTPEVLSLSSCKQETTKLKHTPEVISLTSNKQEPAKVKHSSEVPSVFSNKQETTKQLKESPEIISLSPSKQEPIKLHNSPEVISLTPSSNEAVKEAKLHDTLDVISLTSGKQELIERMNKVHEKLIDDIKANVMNEDIKENYVLETKVSEIELSKNTGVHLVKPNGSVAELSIVGILKDEPDKKQLEEEKSKMMEVVPDRFDAQTFNPATTKITREDIEIICNKVMQELMMLKQDSSLCLKKKKSFSDSMNLSVKEAKAAKAAAKVESAINTTKSKIALRAMKKVSGHGGAFENNVKDLGNKTPLHTEPPKWKYLDHPSIYEYNQLDTSSEKSGIQIQKCMQEVKRCLDDYKKCLMDLELMPKWDERFEYELQEVTNSNPNLHIEDLTLPDLNTSITKSMSCNKIKGAGLESSTSPNLPMLMSGNVSSRRKSNSSLFSQDTKQRSIVVDPPKVKELNLPIYEDGTVLNMPTESNDSKSPNVYNTSTKRTLSKSGSASSIMTRQTVVPPGKQREYHQRASKTDVTLVEAKPPPQHLDLKTFSISKSNVFNEVTMLFPPKAKKCDNIELLLHASKGIGRGFGGKLPSIHMDNMSIQRDTFTAPPPAMDDVLNKCMVKHKPKQQYSCQSDNASLKTCVPRRSKEMERKLIKGSRSQHQAALKFLAPHNDDVSLNIDIPSVRTKNSNSRANVSINLPIFPNAYTYTKYIKPDLKPDLPDEQQCQTDEPIPDNDTMFSQSKPIQLFQQMLNVTSNKLKSLTLKSSDSALSGFMCSPDEVWPAKYYPKLHNTTDKRPLPPVFRAGPRPPKFAINKNGNKITTPAFRTVVRPDLAPHAIAKCCNCQCKRSGSPVLRPVPRPDCSQSRLVRNGPRLKFEKDLDLITARVMTAKRDKSGSREYHTDCGVDFNRPELSKLFDDACEDMKNSTKKCCDDLKKTFDLHRRYQ